MDWLILAGSIAGVLGLAAAAWLLDLGGASIQTGDAACRAAEESRTGFAADQAFVSADGRAALVRGRDGSFVALKVHGAHIAARRLEAPLSLAATPDGVRLGTGDRMFGDLRLALDAEARDKLLALL